MKTIKGYLLLFLTLFVLVSGLVAGCAHEQMATYYNYQFGYSVEMPISWKVIEEPVHMITGRPLENTVGFRSEAKDILKADWVSVEVTEKPSWAIYDERLYLGEYSVQEYGTKGAYLVRWKEYPADREWRWNIFVHHEGKLYEVIFSNEKAKDRVNVFIDGYGGVK